MSISSNPKPLETARRAIDEIDAALLELLNRRANLSLEIGRIKREAANGTPVSIYDPKREQALLDALDAHNAGPLTHAHIRAIWSEILSSSRALQQPKNVAYLGPEGTFSYFAGIEFLGHSTRFHPCANFEDIFRLVQEGSCDLGVVPLENSLQGTVGQNFDLLWRYDVKICAEFLARIRHSLLSREKDLHAVKIIYSHPQPFAQCNRWLRENCPGAMLIPKESTAAAAGAATEPETAAIGHVSLGPKLGLNTLASGIEDDPVNWTRFVLITASGSQSESRSGANKTSLMFTLPDKAGTLAAVLDELASGGVNMRKLESRPLRGECWKYIFFADVECDLLSGEFTPLVKRLRDKCLSFRILGSYPSGMRAAFGDMGEEQR